jgi:hypothetical protein
LELSSPVLVSIFLSIPSLQAYLQTDGETNEYRIVPNKVLKQLANGSFIKALHTHFRND